MHIIAAMAASDDAAAVVGAESSLAGAEQQWNDAMKVIEDKLQVGLQYCCMHALQPMKQYSSCYVHTAPSKDHIHPYRIHKILLAGSVLQSIRYMQGIILQPLSVACCSRQIGRLTPSSRCAASCCAHLDLSHAEFAGWPFVQCHTVIPVAVKLGRLMSQ